MNRSADSNVAERLTSANRPRPATTAPSPPEGPIKGGIKGPLEGLIQGESVVRELHQTGHDA